MIYELVLYYENEFVRVATPDEMRFLRVNSDGKVEYLQTNTLWSVEKDNSLSATDVSEGVNMYWKPAPEWQVRWDYSATMSAVMKGRRGFDVEDYCVE